MISQLWMHGKICKLCLEISYSSESYIKSSSLPGLNGDLCTTPYDLCSAGSVDIDRANQLYMDLRIALQSLVVANHLHMLYVVTPYDLVSQVKPSWMTYFNQVVYLL